MVNKAEAPGKAYPRLKSLAIAERMLKSGVSRASQGEIVTGPGIIAASFLLVPVAFLEVGCIASKDFR